MIFRKHSGRIFLYILVVLLGGCAVSKGPYHVSLDKYQVSLHSDLTVIDGRPADTKTVRIKESGSGKTYYFGDNDFVPVPMDVISKKLKGALSNRITSGIFTVEQFEFMLFEHGPPSTQEILNTQAQYSPVPLANLMAVPLIKAMNPNKGDSWVSCNIVGNFNGRPMNVRYGEFVGSFGMEDHVNSIFDQTMKDLAEEIEKKAGSTVK